MPIAKPASWTTGLLALVVYLTTLAALTLVHGDVDDRPPWWVPLALPPLVYGLVAARWIPRSFGTRHLEAALLLGGVHVGLGVLTGVVWTAIGRAPYDAAVFQAFAGSASAIALQLTFAPLIAWPFRLHFAPPPRPTPTRTAAPAPARAPVIPADKRVAAPKPETPKTEAPKPAVDASKPKTAAPLVAKVTAPKIQPPAPPAASITVPEVEMPPVSPVPDDSLLTTEPATREMSTVEPPKSVAPNGEAGLPTAWGRDLPALELATAEAATPDVATLEVPKLAVPTAKEPRASRVDTDPSQETGPKIRIRFTRVADQLPADAFAQPLAAIGAELREPDVLLVPQHLVAAQVAEGRVHVAWTVVANQFPHAARRMSDLEIAQQLPNGELVLPLDEIFSQLPASFFTLEAHAPDTETLESFPLPFQPPSAPETAAVAAEPAPPTADPATPIEPAAPIDVVESVPLPPAIAEILSRALEGAGSAEGADSPESAPSVDLVDSLRPPVVDETAPPPTAPDVPAPPLAPPVGAEPEADALDELAAALPPLAMASREVLVVGGVPVQSLTAPHVRPETVADAATRALPLLAEGFADQVTLRSDGHAVVVTPIGAADGGRVLVIAPSPHAVALAEIVAQRVAATRLAADPGLNDQSPRATREMEADAKLDARPIDPVLDDIARSLDAFTGLKAAAFHDPETGLDVDVLVGFGAACERLERLATLAYRAVGSAGAPSGRASLTMRLGKHRVFVRAVERTSGPALLIVAGEVRHAGLAERQVERAAVRIKEA